MHLVSSVQILRSQTRRVRSEQPVRIECRDRAGNPELKQTVLLCISLFYVTKRVGTVPLVRGQALRKLAQTCFPAACFFYCNTQLCCSFKYPTQPNLGHSYAQEYGVLIYEGYGVPIYKGYGVPIYKGYGVSICKGYGVTIYKGFGVPTYSGVWDRPPE